MTDLDARRKAYRRNGVTSIIAGLIMTLVAARSLWFYSRDPVTLVLQGIVLIGGVAAICNGWWMLRRSKTMQCRTSGTARRIRGMALTWPMPVWSRRSGGNQR